MLRDARLPFPQHCLYHLPKTGVTMKYPTHHHSSDLIYLLIVNKKITHASPPPNRNNYVIVFVMRVSYCRRSNNVTIASIMNSTL